jgi:hypothetical protein
LVYFKKGIFEENLAENKKNLSELDQKLSGGGGVSVLSLTKTI